MCVARNCTRSRTQLVFGNTFDRPIKDSLPYGTSVATKAVHYIDPALELDLYADKPWALSPLLATFPVVRVSSTDSAPKWSHDQPKEDVSALLKDEDDNKTRLPGDSAARRKVFARKEARQVTEIKPEHFLELDFAQGMINFSNMAVHIPVVNLEFSLLKCVLSKEMSV